MERGPLVRKRRERTEAGRRAYPRKELPVAETNWPSAIELPPAVSEKVCSITMLLSSNT
jgi:stalled ribosome alternative rescue factor ArfA